MRAVIQRVSKANVVVESKTVGSISHGFLILFGVESEDTNDDIDWLADKISKLRIFPDEAGLMNASIVDVGGECLVISQFTLHAKVKKGTRPSFIKAAKPDFAEPMYEAFCEVLSRKLKNEVEMGVFGAHMDVSLMNDGPVTIIIDTKNKE